MTMKENLDVRFTVRFTDAEGAEIRTAADAANLTIAEYIRRSVLGRKITPRIPSTDAHAIILLKQIAGMIKQIFKQEIVDPAETIRILNNCNAVITQLERGSHDH